MKKTIIILTFCSCWLGRTSEAAFPLDPWTMLNSFGGQPQYNDIQNFMSIYKDKYNKCEQPDVFLQVARHLHDQDHTDQAENMLKKLAACPNMEKSIKINVLKDLYFMTPEDKRLEIGQELIKIDPNDTDVLGDLSWREYNAGDCRAATILFRRWYSLTNNSQALSGMFYCRRKLIKDQAQRLAYVADYDERVMTPPAAPAVTPALPTATRNDIRPSKKKSMKSAKQPAGKKQKMSVVEKRQAYVQKQVAKKQQTEGRIFTDKEYNYAFQSGLSVRGRSGDLGRGRLIEIGMPQYFSRIDNWYIQMTPSYLYSGRAPATADVGSSYLRSTLGDRDGGNREKYIAVPEIGYRSEKLDVILGTTAIWAEENVIPTAEIVYKNNGFSLSAYQQSVRDSILSISGLKDQYAGGSWGRVLRDGMSVKYSFEPAPLYFGEIQASGNYYWGKDVKENTSWDVTAIGGKNFGKITLGLLTSIMSFERDQNHFTRGHGGYYSPQTAVQVLPFIAYTTAPSDEYRFKADLGIGYLYEQLKGTPMYFKTPTPQSARYSGAYHNWIIYQVGMEGRRKITQNSFISGAVRAGFSANYYEYNGLINYTVLF